jgi:YcaO-like protein with predicted kinase domain
MEAIGLTEGQLPPALPSESALNFLGDVSTDPEMLPALKVFRGGTHRVARPVETLGRIRRYMAVMGITRIANITGLDRIGIPVTAVCRPNSRSVAVAQGKGADLPAAEASGLMEAIESYHAERITLPLKYATYEELQYTHALIDLDGLPSISKSRFHPELSILWIEGHDLIQKRSVWLPYETVHTNYVYPMPPGSGCFYASSNGLASGNHVLAGISHAICEVVERDSTTLWRTLSDVTSPERRVRLESVTDPGCRELLDRFEAADIAVAIWDTTTDVGIPSFACWIVERANQCPVLEQPTIGFGCHPTREVALSRALTEAAQDRLTVITGARDDLRRKVYEPVSETLARSQQAVFAERPAREFSDAPTKESETLEGDVLWELDQLQMAGIKEVVAVDLTKPEFQIPVARVVIPGLEGPDGVNYVPGMRALTIADGRR